MERKKLSDILSDNAAGADWLDSDWQTIDAAPDLGQPVPRGQYTALIVEGALFTAGTGTPGYKLRFEIAEGDYKGRSVWHDIWLSGKAKNQAVRDLRKIGVTSKEQLEKPIPSRRIRCRVTAVVRKDNDGVERNDVRSFEVLGIDPPPAADPFAPTNGDGKADGEREAEEDHSTNGTARNGELFKPNDSAGPYLEGR